VIPPNWSFIRRVVALSSCSTKLYGLPLPDCPESLRILFATLQLHNLILVLRFDPSGTSASIARRIRLAKSAIDPHSEVKRHDRLHNHDHNSVRSRLCSRRDYVVPWWTWRARAKEREGHSGSRWNSCGSTCYPTSISCGIVIVHNNIKPGSRSQSSSTLKNVQTRPSVPRRFSWFPADPATVIEIVWRSFGISNELWLISFASIVAPGHRRRRQTPNRIPGTHRFPRISLRGNTGFSGNRLPVGSFFSFFEWARRSSRKTLDNGQLGQGGTGRRGWCVFRTTVTAFTRNAAIEWQLHHGDTFSSALGGHPTCALSSHLLSKDAP